MSLNAEISKTLYEIGEILTIKGDRFKSRAYNTAARRISVRWRREGSLKRYPAWARA